MMVCPAVVLVILAIIRTLNVLENSRRDRLAVEHGETHVRNQEFMDLTDGENSQFRYSMVSTSTSF